MRWPHAPRGHSIQPMKRVCGRSLHLRAPCSAFLHVADAAVWAEGTP